MTFVRTVRGDVAPDDLGCVYVHEHLLCAAPPHLENGNPDLVLDDAERSAAELELFAKAGGGAVVDLTTAEYGRDAAGLRGISERSGVHVVAATGHIMQGYWGGVLDLSARSDTELVDELVGDLTEGIDETGVRAGVVKIGTSHNKVTEDEARMFQAAAKAQRQTGAPISTHTTAGTMARAQVDMLRDAGADLERVIIGHLDRRLDWDEHLAVARSGVYLGYDCISKEQYQPDASRIDFIVRLIDEGFGDRICLSGDLARRSYLTSYGGGPGFTYILWRFVPWLRQNGVAEAHIDRLLIDNPARLLAWRT